MRAVVLLYIVPRSVRPITEGSSLHALPRLFAYPTNTTHVPEAIVYPTLFSPAHTSTHPSTHPHPHPYFPGHSYNHTESHSYNQPHTFTRTTAAGTIPATRSPAPFVVPTLLPEPRISRNRIRQAPILIFFEILSGLAGLVLCLGLLRCCNSYRRTPPRDRISDIIQRHQLQVEMEELRRRTPVIAFFFQEPAPPYLPRPPSYPADGLPYLAGPSPPSSDYTPNLLVHPTNHAPGYDAG